MAALRRPGLVLGSVVFCAAASLIVVNALSFQTAPHPAPLFGDVQPRRHIAAPATRSPVAAAPRPIPIEAPAPVPPTRPLEQGLVVPVTAPSSRNVATRDPIADLIRGTGSVPSTGSVPAPDLDPRTLAAQRALARLGYEPMTADGVFGPMTRSAIERFERDRGLPVTGELGARTTRELSSLAGIPID